MPARIIIYTREALVYLLIYMNRLEMGCPAMELICDFKGKVNKNNNY